MTQSVTITNPEQASPEGHDAAMAAKFDAAQGTPTENTAERPAWLPEKFKSVEDMAKAYAELEKKQSTPAPKPADAPAQAPTAQAPAQQPAADDAAAAAAADKAGLKMADLESEFARDGKLSDANLAKLKAAGFSESDVSTYIAGREALATAYNNDVMSATPGGTEKYGEMVEWAKANLSDAEINAYNAAVSSGNKEQAKLAVAGLGAKFSSAVGSEPNLVGGRGNADSGDVFESWAQVTKAMADPQYSADPAYRAKVQAKLERSKV